MMLNHGLFDLSLCIHTVQARAIQAAEAAHNHWDFHRFAVLVCRRCRLLVLPQCSIHDQLFTTKCTDKGWSCAVSGCDQSTTSHLAMGISCTTCGPTVASGWRQYEWVLSDEEAEFAHSAFPKDVVAIPHPVLQCDQCCSVNFPGVDQCLTVEMGGSIISFATSVHHTEETWRRASRHLSAACTAAPMTQVSVILSHAVTERLRDLVPVAPLIFTRPPPPAKGRKSSKADSSVPAVPRMSSASVIPPQPVGSREYVRTRYGLFPTPFIPSTASSMMEATTSTTSLPSSLTSPATMSSSSSSSSSSLATSSVPTDLVTWLTTVDEDALVTLASGSTRTVVSFFELLGRLLAQALVDDRLLDFSLARPFYTALLGRGGTLRDLLPVHPYMAKSLLSMHRITAVMDELRRANASNMAHPLDFSPDDLALLNLDGVPLVDLGLDCSVPKHPHLSVFGAGAPPDLTLGNLHAYVDRVAAFFLADAIARPLQAVRRGFDEIADVSALRCFTEDELDSLLCGGDAIEQSWDLSVDTLNRYCKLQGYMSGDKTIVALFEVISEFTPVQQRQFVRFLTGCPRLPLGGLKNISPSLTIVRDTQSTFGMQDSFLPTVKTCTNTFKLPPYSSKEVLRQKLLLSMREGQCTFQAT
jgi:hypothetical protein